jgi:hypothetical protein
MHLWEPIWSPQPHLCGSLAAECAIDKVVSEYNIGTVIKFLVDKDGLPGALLRAARPAEGSAWLYKL